jgi:transcriptional regulator with XRE-family HTH domain
MLSSQGGVMTTSSSTPGRTLAERVQYLFEVRRRPDGTRYSINEVAAASRGMAAKSNLHNIRNGDNDNPTRETLIALALFFEVPITYFFPELDDQQTTPLPGWPQNPTS